MADEIPDPEGLTEDQLRAAYEQEIKRVRVEQVLLENVVTLVNLGMRRTGIMPGTEDEQDFAQVQLAIESVRALMPQLDAVAPQQAAAIKDALSQLQMAFVRAGGGGAQSADADTPATGSAPDAGGGGAVPGQTAATGFQPPDSAGPGEAGPAQKSGRLWVPGQ